MIRLYHLLLAIIVLALAPVGFGYFSSRSATDNQPKPSQTNSAVNAKATSENTWKKILGTKSAPAGWSVAPCDGSAPLLCVSSEKGELLGTVEVNVYPLDRQPDFQKMLADAGVPGVSPINYNKYQTQISKALNAWVADYYTNLKKDRQSSYGKDIAFSGYPPQEFIVGQFPAMGYGFVGLQKQGGVKEQHFGYVAFDGNQLYVISTAFDSADKTGKFEKLENLAVFAPYLSAIVANLKLVN